MKLAVKWGSRFLNVLAVSGIAMVLAGCQTMIESNHKTGTNIQTVAYKSITSLLSADFNPQQHTLFVSDESWSETHQPLLADMLKTHGIKIVDNKKSADFVLRVTAFVTMPYQDGSALPFSAEYLLSMREELPVIKPLLIPSKDSPGEQIKNMGELVRKSRQGIMGSDTSNAISLGSAFGGGAGGIAAGAIAGIVDVVAGISAQNNIREGLVGFEFLLLDLNVTFGHPTKGMNVYAASTTPEKPEALLRAAVERAVLEMPGKE